AALSIPYIEQARITADPSYYAKAQGALERSFQVKPDDNAEAMIGMGALANARHDFAAARDWGEKVRAIRPDTAEVYAVLTDAYTQLGQPQAATDAVQHMLDLQPGVSSLTRASYDLELHGRVADARTALLQALDESITTSDVAYCRYYLGELAFNSGQLDEAARQYQAGINAGEDSPALEQGLAKVAAARGNLDAALVSYQRVTQQLPLPQYIAEYAELLTVAGRGAQAKTQLELLDAQQRLFAANGVTDDLTAAITQADLGDPAQAVAHGRAEWDHRHMLLVADALSWALHVDGRDAEALGYADQAAATGYRNALFSYHRGMILKALGRDAEARQALSAALRINPYFSPLQAPRARAALAQPRDAR
ncbi:MAG: tetratricopeptide repeat protein, partial [Pseudonocardiaceae bacterium]